MLTANTTLPLVGGKRVVAQGGLRRFTPCVPTEHQGPDRVPGTRGFCVVHH